MWHLHPTYLRHSSDSTKTRSLRLKSRSPTFSSVISINMIEYFTAHSVKEDGSLTPKYYIYAPSLIKEKGCVFSDASCNGVFHFQNWKGNHHLWSPTTNELKTLPESLDMLPGVLWKFELDFGMWCDHRCEDYKVLQVVSNHTEESGIFETVFHFELYSLKSNSWKIIQCKGFSGIGRFSSACINGVFYTPAISLEKEAEFYPFIRFFYRNTFYFTRTTGH